jgi:hypothetical protein
VNESLPRQRPPVISLRALLLALLLVALCLAPTPGDTGGCQPARQLDEQAFFESKRLLDCERCLECRLDSKRCNKSCDDEETSAQRFPEGCLPLTHDGAVCLRALEVASCGDYSEFMADRNASLPTECNFCPPRPQ